MSLSHGYPHKCTQTPITQADRSIRSHFTPCAAKLFHFTGNKTQTDHRYGKFDEHREMEGVKVAVKNKGTDVELSLRLTFCCSFSQRQFL